MINTTFTKLKNFSLGIIIDTKAERMVGSKILRLPVSILVSLCKYQLEINIGKPVVVFDYANIGLDEMERK